MNRTTIFYVNSAGFMSQWRGEVIARDEHSISIRFSKNKALKYNLTNLGIDFVLVTKKAVKDLGVSITSVGTAFSFDEQLKERVKELTKDNVELLWENGKWN